MVYLPNMYICHYNPSSSDSPLSPQAISRQIWATRYRFFALQNDVLLTERANAFSFMRFTTDLLHARKLFIGIHQRSRGNKPCNRFARRERVLKPGTPFFARMRFLVMKPYRLNDIAVNAALRVSLPPLLYVRKDRRW